MQLADYRDDISLDKVFEAPPATPLQELPLAVSSVLSAIDHPGSSGDIQELKRFLTQRPALPLEQDTLRTLDAIVASQAGTAVDACRLQPIADAFPGTEYRSGSSTYLWRGDITTLKVDAIVNAANSALLGCFLPFHACIDNAIHWRAGPRLRLDCATIMDLQGHAEPTGTAKITRGYNLPARFVIHTVGPIVQQQLDDHHQRQLASCYTACLDLAAEQGAIRSVAFCSISTGVFGFPKEPAARIALNTVDHWLRNNPGVLDAVIFNVFSADDEAIYARHLEGNKQDGL